MRRTGLLLLCFVVFAACRDSSTNPGVPDPDFAGTYALQSIAGFPLPYSILSNATFNLEITADTVSLAADGAYVGRTYYRRTSGGAIDFPADTTHGTWGAIGTRVTVEAKGTSFFAQVSSIALLVDPTGIPFSYRKQ